MKKRKVALLFDLDGTLLNTLDDLTNSVNATLANFGFPHRTKEEIRSFIGNGIKKLIERALPHNSSEELVLKCLNFFTKHYQDHINDYSKPYPGIIKLIKECHKQEVKMAVVTNKFQTGAVALVKRYFSPYIQVVVGQRFGRLTKPDPEPVYEALKKLDLQKSNDLILYVGDSDVDILTARNAELPVICVDWGFKERSDLQKFHTDYLVSFPEEILTILKQLKHQNE
jgi:phosphoglycolate phosphatase